MDHKLTKDELKSDELEELFDKLYGEIKILQRKVKDREETTLSDNGASGSAMMLSKVKNILRPMDVKKIEISVDEEYYRFLCDDVSLERSVKPPYDSITICDVIIKKAHPIHDPLP